MKLRKMKKAVLWDWLFILVSLFILIVLWFYLNPYIYDLLDFLGIETSSETAQMLLFVWDKFPFILVGGLLIFGFVASQRRDPNYGYY
jgi:hypothetical protein